MDDFVEGNYFHVDTLLEFLEAERENHGSESTTAYKRAEELSEAAEPYEGYRWLRDYHSGAHDAILDVIHFVKGEDVD